VRPRILTTIAAVLGLALALPPAASAKDVHLRGTAYQFNQVETRLGGATVRVVERPDLSATVRPDGSYDLKVPDRATITPYIEAAGYHRIHLQTFRTAGEDLRGVNFQVPTDAVYQALVALLQVPTGANGDPAQCAIVSTFSTRNVRGVGFEAFIGYGAHGVAGATATASPPLPPPVYFNERVLPDPLQRLSSEDGGVIWTGVPAGTYTIRASHPDTRFASFTATCVPGRVVNANPPWGLHELGLPNEARVIARWAVDGSRTRLRTLTATRLPDGATVRLRCTGRRCPFQARTVKPRRGRIVLPRADRRLRTGQTLEVTVSAPAHDGAVTRWRVRANRSPKRTVRCVPLGYLRARPQSACGS